MKAALIAKYVFSIRTRGGVAVENIAIYGKDEEDARCKLFRMYKGCEILDWKLLLPTASPGRSGAASYEDVVELIVAA